LVVQVTVTISAAREVRSAFRLKCGDTFLTIGTQCMGGDCLGLGSDLLGKGHLAGLAQ
jgi:hypothetical protein